MRDLKNGASLEMIQNMQRVYNRNDGYICIYELETKEVKDHIHKDELARLLYKCCNKIHGGTNWKVLYDLINYINKSIEINDTISITEPTYNWINVVLGNKDKNKKVNINFKDTKRADRLLRQF